jgi:hypothetical protein
VYSEVMESSGQRASQGPMQEQEGGVEIGVQDEDRGRLFATRRVLQVRREREIPSRELLIQVRKEGVTALADDAHADSCARSQPTKS